MDRRPPGIGPESEDNQELPRDASAPPDDLTEAEWDEIFPPIDDDDPEWQAYVRRKVRESLDDPRPSIPAEEVRRHLRELHEERLRRDAKGEPPRSAAAEPLDPELVRMIQEALDDPRPSIPADEAFAQVYAHIEQRRARRSARD